jgi:hypothetical protein
MASKRVKSSRWAGLSFVLAAACFSDPLIPSGHAQPESGSTVEKMAKPEGYVPVPGLPNILLLGDSISMGYTQPVRDLLKGKANVFRPVSAKHVSENCEGTTAGVRNLERWMGTNRWAVIHFNFGLHDLKWVKAPGDPGMSSNPNDPRQADLATYEANLDKIVTRLRQTGARLVFATTTPVPEDVATGRTAQDVPRYNAAAFRVMKRHNIPVNDLYGFCQPKLKQIQKKKNVHFTDAGSLELAREVARAIEAQLPETTKEGFKPNEKNRP